MSGQYAPIAGQPGRSICELNPTRDWRVWRWRCECGMSGGPWSSFDNCCSESADHRCAPRVRTPKAAVPHDGTAASEAALARIRDAAALCDPSDISTTENLAAFVDTALEVGRSNARECVALRRVLTDIATICGSPEWETAPDVVGMVRGLRNDEREACAKAVRDAFDARPDCRYSCTGGCGNCSPAGAIDAAIAAIRARSNPACLCQRTTPGHEPGCPRKGTPEDLAAAKAWAAMAVPVKSVGCPMCTPDGVTTDECRQRMFDGGA